MDFYQPSQCFCHYDIRDLLSIARLKFKKGESTLELMRQAKNDEERSRVAIVSMLDLDDSQVTAILTDKATGPHCHILSCRDMLKHQLEKLLENGHHPRPNPPENIS